MTNDRSNGFGWLIAVVMTLFFPTLAYGTVKNSIQRLEATDYQRAEQFLSWNKDNYIRNDTVVPNWVGDEESFWYLRKDNAGGKEFVRVDAATGSRSPAFDQKTVAAELTRLGEEKVIADNLPFDSFSYTEEGGIAFQIADKHYRCGNGTCEALEAPPTLVRPGETPSPNGKWAVYFKDNNLWVRALDGSTDYALTTDGEPDDTYGISTGTDTNMISRRRLGQVDAPLVTFSPDGSKLLTQRIDQRRVGMLHLLQNAPEDGSYRPVLHSMRYALALDEHLPMATFVVFDLNTGKRVNVDYPAIPIFYAPHVHPMGKEIRWREDGQHFYFIHRYRYGRGFAINHVDATTGKTRQVAERKVEATAFPAYTQVMPAVLEPAGDGGVIWYSNRTGWGHLYLSDNQGKVRQLTSGNWNVIGVQRVDPDAEVVYFTRSRAETEGNPYHLVVSSVRMDGSGFKTLTPEPGLHQFHAQSFSPGGRYFVDNYSSTEQPAIAKLRRSDGKLITKLEQTDIAELGKIGVVLPETFQTLAADGKTRLWGKLLKPSNFDPKKSYPVIDSIYPGPQINRVNHSFNGMMSGGLYDAYGEPQALAELGFIVVTVDGRGTPGRSRSFHYDTEKSLLGDAGHLDDHVAAIKALAQSRPWMDLDRVGIFGHSGGGYASTHAMLVYPEFFKVAVSSAGNHEQRVYLPTWGEAYLGEDDGENYSLASNPDLAAKLKGKLFIVVGDMDDNVHPAHSYQLVNALIKANRDFDLLSLPNANHGFASLTNVEKPYFIRRQWDYFVTHLLGAKPPRDYAISGPDSE